MGYSKDLYYFCKEHGICVRCHKEKAVYKLYCGKCKEKQDILRLNKPKRTGQEREEYNQKLKDYREKLKSQGICIWCAKKKAVEGKTLCLECSLKQRNSKKNTTREKVIILFLELVELSPAIIFQWKESVTVKNT